MPLLNDDGSVAACRQAAASSTDGRVRRGSPDRRPRPLTKLELPDAIRLARAPPAHGRFDAGRWKTRLREKGVGEQALVRQVGLTLSNYRRLLNGRIEPSLLTLTRFASVVDVPVEALLAVSEQT